MVNLSNVFTSPHFYSSVSILLSVLALKALLSRVVTRDPLSFFNFYCSRLADKVNKDSNSEQQQKISGLIAIVVTLMPLLVILWLFEAFIAVNWIWQALLLYFAFGSFGATRNNKAIAKSLVANSNYQAKQSIAPFVLRDTEQLSSLGISKACIESQLLRTAQLLVFIAFYYLAFGPLAAIACRLLLAMHYSWNIKLYRYRHFGRAIHLLISLLQWLPSRLMALLLLFGTLGQNTLLFWRLTRAKFFASGNGLLIELLALSLGIQLSGVAMYNGVKLRKPSYNDQGRHAQATDIIHGSKRINNTLVLFAIIILSLALLSYLLHAAH